jgi:hypothetical protein
LLKPLKASIGYKDDNQTNEEANMDKRPR